MDTLKKIIRPRARNLRAWILTAAFVAVGLTTMSAAYTKHQAAADFSERLGKLRAERTRIERPALHRLDPAIEKHWDTFRAERGFHWDLVFDAIEHTATENIELLGFEPDKHSGRLVLQGEAKNNEALTAYLAALSSQSQLQNIYLSHEQIIAHDHLSTIEFEIHASINVL